MKPNKSVVLFFCIVAASLNLSAQNSVISARLLEKGTNEPVPFATVSITSKGAAKPSAYVLSDENGNVKLTGVTKGSYLFKAELLGYIPITREIQVTDQGLKLGDLSFETDNEQLNAAMVTATGNPVIIKKDTIEFNASSFKTTENDVLEDLLKKLPGIEIGDDGSITANGRTINKITIDGKTFFLDDPQLASKNIPAKVINKVKVIDKKSEQAEFTGIDDGEEETIIDLSIRPGMLKGLFGNVMAGGGHDIPANDNAPNDWRYQGAAFMGRFTDKSQLSVILNANNTNNRGFNDLSGSMMGNMRGGRGMGSNGGGITTTYMGGINGAWTLLDDRMNLGGNYLFNGTEKNVQEVTSKTTHNTGFDQIYNNTGLDLTNSYGHRFGIRLDHKFSDNTSILFQPQVNFGNGNFRETSDFSTNTDDFTGSIAKTNSGFSVNTGSNRNWTTNGFLLFRQKLGKPGRTMTVNVNYRFSNNDLSGLNQSLTTTYNKADSTESIINQRYDQNSNNASLTGKITYTEPIAEHFYVEANYSYSWNRSTSFKNTYDSGSNEGFNKVNPIYYTAGETLNSTYSNRILNEYVNQIAGINLLYQREKFRAQVGVGIRPTKTHNETTSGGVTKVYDSNVLNWAPQAMVFGDFSENSRLMFRYNGNSSQPSTTQLMPVPDNSNPLNIKFGNPRLTPYFTHRLNADFRYNNRQNFTSLNVRLGGSMVQNPITNAIWTQKAEGIQYSVPLNGPNSYSANLNAFLNVPIAKSNFSISSNTNAGISRSSSFVGTNIPIENYYKEGVFNYDSFLDDYEAGKLNFAANTTRTFNIGERLNFIYRSDNLELRLGGRARYAQSTYTIETSTDTKTWNNFVMGSVNWTIEPVGMTLKTDYSYNWYVGYQTPQPSQHRLNAEISQLLFKKKFTLSLKAYDILGQSKNLTVSDSDNYHKETLNNTLGRYLILSLTYRFGNFDRSKMRGPGGGGPGMGGPPMR